MMLALAAAPEAAEACPCYGIDPECWQRHPVCAEQTMGPLVEEDEAAADQPPPPPEPVFISWPRRGLILRGSAGITHCAQGTCDAIPMGGLARFDLAYRLGFYSIYGTISGGGGVLDVPDQTVDGNPITGINGGLTFLFAGGGMMLHPVDLGRVDPWLGVALGYSRVEQRFNSDQGSSRLIISRAGVELGGGLDIFVHRRVALGPRFDVVFPFGGSQCLDDECVNVADVVNRDTPFERRSARRVFPRPWSVTVGVTVFVL